MSDKIAFLDRDGVINEKAPPHDYIKSWAEFRFKPGAIEGIKLLNEAGYKVVIVTNQRGIARGMMAEEMLNEIHQNMIEVLKTHGAVIDAIFYCPHENGTCTCRKPDIGLFLQAEKNFMIDKSRSFIIGDSQSDIEAGKRYGIKSYLICSNQILSGLVKLIVHRD